MVPFTSPVAMPARQALERVPTAQLAVAAGGLVVTAALPLRAGRGPTPGRCSARRDRG
jgi:hypothetical protein